MLRNTLITLAVSSSMLLLSCSENPSKVRSPDVKNDLQKLANVVDHLQLFDFNKTQSQSLKKFSVREGCICLGAGVKAGNCGGDEDADTSKQRCRSSLHVTVKEIENSTSVPENMQFGIPNISVEGTGEVDYFNDDLVLNFTKFFLKIENGATTYDYRISIFDDTYSIVLKGTINHNSIPANPSDTDIDISGPIILTSTGETVGTFNQLFSWDIQILDKDGVVIKKTDKLN